MMENITATISGGVIVAGFGWLMFTTECRPLLPLVKLIVELGGAA